MMLKWSDFEFVCFFFSRFILHFYFTFAHTPDSSTFLTISVVFVAPISIRIRRSCSALVRWVCTNLFVCWRKAFSVFGAWIEKLCPFLLMHYANTLLWVVSMVGQLPWLMPGNNLEKKSITIHHTCNWRRYQAAIFSGVKRPECFE